MPFPDFSFYRYIFPDSLLSFLFDFFLNRLETLIFLVFFRIEGKEKEGKGEDFDLYAGIRYHICSYSIQPNYIHF